MEAGDLVQVAESLLGLYREMLLIDPFYRVKVEVGEGDFISNCTLDRTAPLTWALRLNPTRHEGEEDVAYSVVEGLLRVLFYSLEIAGVDKAEEAKNGLISRLATGLAAVLPLTASEPETEPEDPAT